MAKVLKNIFNAGTDEIKQSFTIESWHVSQSIDAFTGVQDYDITISGSLTLTGSANITGSTVINGGVTINGSPTVNGALIATQGITSSLFGTSSWSSNSISSSYALSSSHARSGSYALSSSYAFSSTSASYARSGSYTLSSSYALSSSQAQSSSYALSSSYTANAVYNGNMSFIDPGSFTSITVNNHYYSSTNKYILSDIDGTDPSANGDLSVNSSTPSTVTIIEMDRQDSDGTTISALANVDIGSTIQLQSSTGTLNSAYIVTSVVSSPGFYRFSVKSLSTTGTFVKSASLIVSIITYKNQTISTGYTKLNIENQQSGQDLKVRFVPSNTNNIGDIAIVEVVNNVSSNDALDFSYAQAWNSTNGSPNKYSSDIVTNITSGEPAFFSFMTIQSGSLKGLMPLGYENFS